MYSEIEIEMPNGSIGLRSDNMIQYAVDIAVRISLGRKKRSTPRAQASAL